jgi:hypothetical protein
MPRTGVLSPTRNLHAFVTTNGRISRSARPRMNVYAWSPFRLAALNEAGSGLGPFGAHFACGIGLPNPGRWRTLPAVWTGANTDGDRLAHEL